MSSTGDVRAGKAFVEVGANDVRLIRELKGAMGRVRAWAAEARHVAHSIFHRGTSVVEGLLHNAEAFAESGRQLSILKKQTGLSDDALTGLVKTARAVNGSTEGLDASLGRLQRNLETGSKGASDALRDMGLSIERIRNLPLGDSLDEIADGMGRLRTANERVTAANALFGKGWRVMLPILEQGSAGLHAAAAAARESGTAITEHSLAAAEDLHHGFVGLTGATRGLKFAIAETSAQAIVPFLRVLSMAAKAVSVWIRQHPEHVRAIFNVALAVSGLGAAFLALATTIYALSSPIIVTTALLAALAAGALAVTDALGVTDTGFGDLFNSLRIQGLGIGTWLTIVAKTVAGAWSASAHRIAAEWAWLDKKLTTFGTSIQQQFEPIAQSFLRFLDVVAPEFAEATRVGRANANDNLARQRASIPVDDDRAMKEHVDAIDKIGESLNAEFGKLVEKDLNRHPNAPRNGIDREAAVGALSDIGRKVGEAITDSLQRIAGDAHESPAGAGALRLPQLSDQLETVAEAARKIDVAGTFNASAAFGLGFGSNLEERQAKATEETARNTRAILEEVRNGEGGGLFA